MIQEQINWHWSKSHNGKSANILTEANWTSYCQLGPQLKEVERQISHFLILRRTGDTALSQMTLQDTFQMTEEHSSTLGVWSLSEEKDASVGGKWSFRRKIVFPRGGIQASERQGHQGPNRPSPRSDDVVSWRKYQINFN